MSNFDFETLNDEQKKALVQTEGVVLVTAGAGSGKTRLLTHRIGYLLQKGVSPFNILAITFTNKATNEMKTRIAQMCDAPIWISTFHSMCVRILRNEIDHLDGYTKNFSIIDDADRDKILKELLKKYQCEDDDKEKVEKHIDNIKNKGLDIDEYFSSLRQYLPAQGLKIYQQICYDYEDYLHKNNSLDFDDLLNKTLFLFCNYRDVLDKYAQRFRYILVDEFQDTNLVQYKLIKMLCHIHKNLFVVGDEDQCIYSWRGANFENIFNLKKDFDDVKVFKLEQNYRSSKNILTMANNVIANNRQRLDKNLWTQKDNGEPPVIYAAFDERDEAMFVASTIENMVCEGYSYNDFAVLMRVNALSRTLEEGLLAYQIPYKLFGGFKFYERAEVKIVLAYLSIFSNHQDDISLFKVINFPKRGIGDVAISNLQDEAGDLSVINYLLSDKFEFSKYKSKLSKFVETFKTLEAEKDTLSLYDFVKRVVSDFGIDMAYAGKDEESQNKLENIGSLLAGVQEYCDENDDANLEDYLAEVMLKSDTDNIQEDGSVTLATVHAVKGLEFKVVFVVGLEEGIFPLARSNNSESELEEERRLMYVAITRAENKIFLIHAAKRFMYGKSTYQKESRFLAELGIVDKAKPKKSTPAAKNSFFVEDKDETFDSGYKEGDKVFHSRFGIGKIVNISDDGLVADIDFEDVGTKSLMLNLASLEKVED